MRVLKLDTRIPYPQLKNNVYGHSRRYAGNAGKKKDIYIYNVEMFVMVINDEKSKHIYICRSIYWKHTRTPAKCWKQTKIMEYDASIYPAGIYAGKGKKMKKKLIYIEDLARKLDIQKKPPPKTSAYGFLMKEEPPDKMKELLEMVPWQQTVSASKKEMHPDLVTTAITPNRNN